MLSQGALTRWLWSTHGGAQRAARAGLWPLAVAYSAAMRLRARTYRHGLRRRIRLERPVIGVGNLTVGGAGKTPLAGWIARYCSALGATPAIVLRGYGGDEAQIHRENVPEALVVEGADRPAAARVAIANGAGVVVLDDAFQRLDLMRDLDLALVSAESLTDAPWTLPAGPWREPFSAARRADFAVITRKRATDAAVREAARRLSLAGLPPEDTGVVALPLIGFHGLLSGRAVAPSQLHGAHLVAACGIADPASFARQCEDLGGQVHVMAWSDHHPFAPGDVDRLVSAGADVDYVVVTAKDAVKLRRLWPPSAREPLVARLGIQWERGRERFTKRISDLLTSHYRHIMY